jgi:uncharacterized protein (TIGR02594 family)
VPVSHTAVSLASRFTGIRELPGADHNARIVAMLQRRFGPGKGPPDDETPWCAAFVGEIAWLLGLPEPASEWLRARSWLTVGTPVTLDNALAQFDVVILNRAGGPQDPAIIKAPGHVGWYFGHTQAEISLLGGNQGNTVSVRAYPRSALLGVRRLHDG